MRRLALVALALLVAAGCSDDEPAATGPATERIEDVAEALGCTSGEPVPASAAPVRAGAANEGIACVGLDVFQRAGDGSLAALDRLLGTGTDPGCGWLVLTGDWFVVAAERGVAERAADLGGTVRGIEPVSPSGSYACPTVGP